MSKHISRTVMEEGIETIDELISLIDSQPEVELSNKYIRNVLARLKNATIPAAYSAGRREK